MNRSSHNVSVVRELFIHVKSELNEVWGLLQVPSSSNLDNRRQGEPLYTVSSGKYT